MKYLLLKYLLLKYLLHEIFIAKLRHSVLLIDIKLYANFRLISVSSQWG
jgi:hypothetical protein